MLTTAILTLLVGLLAYCITALLTWWLLVASNLYYNVMAVELLFQDSVSSIGGTFTINLVGLYKAIYTFAIALLILMFVKKLVETYFTWSNGDPETSPFSVLIGFLKALIIMICFGFLYKTFVQIFYNFYQAVAKAGFGGDLTDLANEYMNMSLGYALLNILGYFFTVIDFIFFALIYFQSLGRGIEMLILRCGMPFACIGLLNADGGAFRGYIQKFLKVVFTVILQLLLVELAMILTFNTHIILGLATAMLAYKTPGLLNEFMVTAGGYYGMQGASNKAMMAIRMFKK